MNEEIKNPETFVEYTKKYGLYRKKKCMEEIMLKQL